MIYFKFLPALTVLTFLQLQSFGFQSTPPNVILIMTDDQGYGDFGFTGNQHVNTPTLDKLASQSIQFTRFFVSPVCAPTRSSLMTGRYSLRTGVRDTYNGGATMATEEITLAELLKTQNYQTGIFGKWHLGDNYPFRPIDQGFDESVVHLSGGMGQVGDFTTYFQGNRSYFDPVLWKNGKQQKYDGYCSDIFTSEAINFIKQNQDKPFFCYLAFNAPHTPLQVPDEYYEKYKNIDPEEGYDDNSKPFYDMNERNKEDARKVYAMVENIDDNLNKLFKTLKKLKIEDNTIIIFLTDNGPQQQRYVAGLKGRKGKVYNGGVRVPMMFKYPNGKFKTKEISTNAVHMDIVPTLAELCGFELPDDRKIDGKSLLPLMKGEEVSWENRSLFFYWTRRFPEKYKNMAVLKSDDKLVANTDYNGAIKNFELYSLSGNLFEKQNVVKENNPLALSLKSEMDQFFEELTSSPHLVHQRPIIGTAYENPVVLNRNDAAGQRGIWAQSDVEGYWPVQFKKGTYSFKIKLTEEVDPGGTAFLEIGSMIFRLHIDENKTDTIEFTNIALEETEASVIPYYTLKNKRYFAFYVEVIQED